MIDPQDPVIAKHVDQQALAEWFAYFRGRYCEYTLNEACLLDVIADREARLSDAQTTIADHAALRKQQAIARTYVEGLETTLRAVEAFVQRKDVYGEVAADDDAYYAKGHAAGVTTTKTAIRAILARPSTTEKPHV